MIKRGLVLTLTILFLLNYTYALEEGYCATAQITSIDPTSIEADEDFTVGITIDNCGDKIPENIIFEITRKSDDIQVKESLINEIGEMGYSNSKRFILYHMHTSPNISPGEHTFETKLKYGSDNFYIEKESTFSVTINSQEPDLAISRIYTDPEIITEGEKIILTIDIENAGNGDAKNTKIELENFDLGGVKQKYLGRIKPDESIPARFVFDKNNHGIYSGNAKVYYEFGGENKEISFPIEIQIFQKEKSYLYALGIILAVTLLGYTAYQKKSNSRK